MTHPVDAMLEDAAQAVERMKAAALEARRLQARAELARHMRTTARKLAHLPPDSAAAAITREWMKAWALGEDAYAAVAPEVAAFTQAFVADAGIREAFAALEAAFLRRGTTLADEMAFRSECAHGWWRFVVPVPPALQDPARAARIPCPAPDAPFWSAGPQAHCL
jgi:hypothetical protein